MAEAEKSLGSIRFGRFELSADSGELRKDGIRLKLSGQAIQVLAMLVASPGKLVTREELQRKLWPGASYGDPEHGLNAAVNKLRETLGDSATDPTYIETVPGRGYRFVGKIEPDESPPAPVEPESKKPRWRWKPALVALALVTALIAGWSYYRSRHVRGRLTEKDTIVLADFVNTTGDDVFDGALKQGLSVQLGQSPFLDLVSEHKVSETLKLMGRPADDRLTPEVAREVCQRTGSTATVAGSIAGLGSQYVIGVKVVNCTAGDLLAEVQEQAANKESVLKALDNAVVHLRSMLGESRSSVQQYAVPLGEVTTPSLEALKAFSVGRRMQLAEGENAALPFYRRAVELDPNFAIAYAALSYTYNNLDQQAPSLENARKAYELRAKVSERERFVIEESYRLATGELEKAAQVAELWKQTYPRDYLPYGDLGIIYASLGNWEQALEEACEAHRREPNAANTYANLGFDYTSLNRLDDAEAVFKEAQDRKLGGEMLPPYRYRLAFLRGDTTQMRQLAAAPDGLLDQEAATAAWYGRYKKARDLTLAVMDSAQRNDAKEFAAEFQAAAALNEVEVGNAKRAQAEVIAAAKLAPSHDVWAIGALALARAGDRVMAGKLASELDKTYPLDTLVQRYTLPTIQAADALARKDPKRAIELLKVTSAIELGEPTNLNVVLCPAYLRGEAYLMLHDGNAAAAEFQKFIDYRGLVVNFPWGALARLGLARAYALQGDTTKSKAAYQDFFALWKDADPDIPILKLAKAEYSKVH
jgi:DNA-binding winged helix-turn-helix (wHTH) protein/tetratricopeptide (TPR) repeat protein